MHCYFFLVAIVLFAATANSRQIDIDAEMQKWQRYNFDKLAKLDNSISAADDDKEEQLEYEDIAVDDTEESVDIALPQVPPNLGSSFVVPKTPVVDEEIAIVDKKSEDIAIYKDKDISAHPAEDKKKEDGRGTDHAESLGLSVGVPFGSLAIFLIGMICKIFHLRRRGYSPDEIAWSVWFDVKAYLMCRRQARTLEVLPRRLPDPAMLRY